MAKVRRSLLFLLISALSLLITTPTIVHAVTFVVDDAGDAPDNIPGNGVCATRGGVCTLRAAIVEANVLPGADTITFASGITQIDITYQLITTSDLTINGVGVTVDAGGTGRVFFVPRGALTINGLTITGGRTRAADEGGAGLLITNGATVILQAGAVVSGNITEAGGGGVTVLNAGSSLHLRDGAQITGNSSPWGGGIGVGLQASVTITGSGTAVTANEARWGGGLYVHAGATVLIEQDAVVSAHTDGVVSGGGVYIFGHGSTLRVNHATIAGNRATVGGGIYVTDAAQVTLENGAVITDNHATDGDGGGIYLAIDNTGLTVTESCISYNTAAGSGAAVYSGGTADISQSCLVGNGDLALDYAGSPTASLVLAQNWWGSAWGPSYAAGASGLRCSPGDSLNPVHPLSSYGLSVLSAGVCPTTAPVGTWLTAPTAGCTGDERLETVAAERERACSPP